MDITRSILTLDSDPQFHTTSEIDGSNSIAIGQTHGENEQLLDKGSHSSSEQFLSGNKSNL